MFIACRWSCDFNCCPQADVFSYGVMMYEVMHRYIMLSAVSVAGTYEELEEYTARVAAGYRPPLHSNMPASITSIIQVGRLPAAACSRENLTCVQPQVMQNTQACLAEASSTSWCCPADV
jgi:hypothetical protein